MKYLKKYISSLSSNVKVIESKKSNSVYVVLDGSFKIRLSDHERLNPHSGVKMEIISIWKSDDFLLFVGNTHIPLVKNRAQLREHIKVTYENWALEHYKNLSDVLNFTKPKQQEEGQEGISLKDCKTYDDFHSYISDKYNEHNPFDGAKCSVILGNMNPSIPKYVRSYLCGFIDEGLSNAPMILYLVKKYGTRLNSKEVADDVINKFRKNMENEHEEEGH